MRLLLIAITFLLLLNASSGLQCKDGEDYLRMVKKSRMNGYNDMFTIKDDTPFSELFDSPDFFDNETRVMEACIKANENHYYYLQMRSRYQEKWSSGAWVELYGINGNMVLKAAPSIGETSFTLYAPVNKRDR